MPSFIQLGLSDEVLKVLSELGFENPTDIQKQAIPFLIQGNNDFIGLAQTGTGKTAAFGLPLIERIDHTAKHTQALVLAPTRELGQQIAEQLNIYSKYLHKLNVLPVYGGAAITNQIKALKKPQHIIIATPGRLIDLIKRKAVKLDQLDYLILDEADEMLNMGFKEDIDKILSYTPEDKLTWLFSATMPDYIKKIVKKYMEDPIEVRINAEDLVNTNIEHEYVVVRQSDKTEALTRIIDINPDIRSVVFCRTKRDTQELSEKLLAKNYKADAIHGDLSQSQRDRVMKRFKSHNVQILCATDVAARGIDVSDLTHVIHYTLPDDSSYYTHRSGRTARAGKKGVSLALVNGRETGKINNFQRRLGIEFKKVLVPDNSIIIESRIENWCQDIIEKKSKGDISPEILEKVNTMFEDLSKEELITTFLTMELDKLGMSSSRDLNTGAERRSSGRDRDGDRDRNRSGRGGRGRGRSGGSDRRRARSGDRDRDRDNDKERGGYGGSGKKRKDFKKSDKPRPKSSQGSRFYKKDKGGSSTSINKKKK